MKLTLDGKTYSADMLSLYRLTLAEARDIKRHTGLTLADWRFGLVTFFREDPDVLAGMVAVLRRRAGEVVDWDDIGQLNAQDFIDGLELEPVDQEQMDRAQQAGVGPPGDASPPEPADAATPD